MTGLKPTTGVPVSDRPRDLDSMDLGETQMRVEFSDVLKVMAEDDSRVAVLMVLVLTFGISISGLVAIGSLRSDKVDIALADGGQNGLLIVPAHCMVPAHFC